MSQMLSAELVFSALNAANIPLGSFLKTAVVNISGCGLEFHKM